jgi:hypothetical protein
MARTLPASAGGGTTPAGHATGSGPGVVSLELGVRRDGSKKSKITPAAAKAVRDVWITSLVPQSAKVVVLKNAKMQGLLSELQECVTESAAPKTLARYTTPWRQWIEFCVELGGIEPIPAPPLEFSLFLLDVARRSATSSNVKAAKSAASFFHKLAERPKPGLYPMVATTYASICRRMKSPEHIAEVKKNGVRTGKASVLGVVQIWKLATRFARHSCLVRRQCFVVFIVSVGGFFRAGELIDGALLMGDIVDLDQAKFGEERRQALLIFIETSKTDKERHGAWIPLPYGAQSVSLTPPAGLDCAGIDCVTPGLWLRRFLLSERRGADGNEPVFGMVAAATRKSSQSIRGGTSLSYSRYNEVLKEMGGDVGIPVENLSAHSGRATGATLAAERGVCDRLFKRFGRWTSDRAKDGYVHESIGQMLTVPSSLFG